MPHVFGKALTLSFTPLANNQPIAADSLVSARLFKDHPTEAQTTTPATPGFISEAVSWTSGTDLEKVIAFPAVVDPTPNSTAQAEQYWAVINYKQDAGGSTIYTVEPILIYRPDGITSSITTTAAEVLLVDKKLSSFYTTAELNNLIKDVKKDILRWFRALNVPLRYLADLDELNDACRYGVAAKACLILYNAGEPSWLEKFKEYKAAYEAALRSAKPLVDVGADGDASEVPGGGTVFITR